MSASFTPGPWWVEKRGALQIQAAHGGPGSSYCVATVNGWEDHEANARLIATAPRMLAALQGVLLIADRRTDEFDEARAAIAEATGEAA